jgi:hypothetical protein
VFAFRVDSWQCKVFSERLLHRSDAGRFQQLFWKGRDHIWVPFRTKPCDGKLSLTHVSESGHMSQVCTFLEGWSMCTAILISLTNIKSTFFGLHKTNALTRESCSQMVFGWYPAKLVDTERSRAASRAFVTLPGYSDFCLGFHFHTSRWWSFDDAFILIVSRDHVFFRSFPFPIRLRDLNTVGWLASRCLALSANLRLDLDTRAWRSIRSLMMPIS